MWSRCSLRLELVWNGRTRGSRTILRVDPLDPHGSSYKFAELLVRIGKAPLQVLGHPDANVNRRRPSAVPVRDDDDFADGRPDKRLEAGAIYVKLDVNVTAVRCRA